MVTSPVCRIIFTTTNTKVYVVTAAPYTLDAPGLRECTFHKSAALIQRPEVSINVETLRGIFIFLRLCARMRSTLAAGSLTACVLSLSVTHSVTCLQLVQTDKSVHHLAIKSDGQNGRLQQAN